MKGVISMREPIKFLRNDFCKECATDNVEAYDSKHRGIGLSRIIDLNNKGTEVNINTREIGYMRCKQCNTRYRIEWTGDNLIPRPLRNDKQIDNFLIHFKEDN